MSGNKDALHIKLAACMKNFYNILLMDKRNKNSDIKKIRNVFELK